MNILLDTHVLLWWLRNSARLGKQAKARIRDSGTMVWIGSASICRLLDPDAKPR
jgi:PIN domain nuclease of toxin-antitoxin system